MSQDYPLLYRYRERWGIAEYSDADSRQRGKHAHLDGESHVRGVDTGRLAAHIITREQAAQIRGLPNWVTDPACPLLTLTKKAEPCPPTT